MPYALKRLLLGFVLIAGGSAVLLISDLQHRKRARAAAVVIDESGRRKDVADPTLPGKLAPLTASASPGAAASVASPTGQEKPVRTWHLRFVNFVETPFVEDVHRGFFDELKRMGLIRGRDFEIKVTCAQGDMSALPTLLNEALSAEPDVILTTSTPTLQTAVKTVTGIPVLFAAVADAVMAGAGKSRDDHAPNVTGIETTSDVARMMKVVRQCLPGARRVGTLFTPSEINSVLYRDMLAKAAGRIGMELVALPTATSSDVADTALSLVSKDIDAICQISDNLHGISFPAIAQAAQNAKKPLFGFVSEQARSGGAVVAVATDFDQAGRDLAHLLDRVMHGERPAAIPFQRVSHTLLVVNLNSALLCGFTIPQALVKSADEVVGR